MQDYHFKSDWFCLIRCVIKCFDANYGKCLTKFWKIFENGLYVLLGHLPLWLNMGFKTFWGVFGQFLAKFKNSSKLCQAISEAWMDLFWICKNLKSSIFNKLHVVHVGLCHWGVFMMFLETLTDKNVKNRPIFG